MDPVLQAYTGLMSENRGEDGIPHRVPVIVVDMSTALYAFQALSAALYARRDETRGRYIDVSLMQAATALQSIRLMACHLEGGTMKPGGAPGGVFQTADGWMSILALNDRDWREPVRGDGDAGAGRRSALRHAGAAARQRRRALRHRAAGARGASRRPTWSKRLTEARLMHERLNSYADFLDQPHVQGDRPDPVADPGRPQPAGAGARPARHAAAARRHAARHRAGHRPAHRRDPAAARLRRRPRSTPCWRKGIVAARHDHALSIRPAIAARRGRTAAASPSTSPSTTTPGASAARRSRRPVPSPTIRASTGCRCWSPAAAWCCRRPTARSTCARPSSRCASPARRRS